jgi:hypothetical protein
MYSSKHPKGYYTNRWLGTGVAIGVALGIALDILPLGDGDGTRDRLCDKHERGEQAQE